MKVKAISAGYLGHRRRKEGDVFHIEDHLFSKEWMIDLNKVDEVEAEELEGSPSKVDSSYTVDELLSYCKDNGLRGYSGLTKPELIEAINNDELSKSDDAEKSVI